MNTIKAKIDKSDYEIYDDFMNFQIDGYWLDEKLDELFPNHMYKGLIPTLVFAMEIDKEKEIVWNRIMPNENNYSICPILMCPDDCDFSGTLIVAQIETLSDRIIWKRIGIDYTREFEAEKIGTTVKWFDKMEPLEFLKSEYEVMLEEFRKQNIIDQVNWEIRNREFKNEKRKN